jgi:hypothetical protein
MIHRVRARVRYPAASWLAFWCRDQMAVRAGQAAHLADVWSGSTPPTNKVVDEGGTHVFICDLPLQNEAHAVDAVATLTAASVWLHVLPLDVVDGSEMSSWVERHVTIADGQGFPSWASSSEVVKS